MRYARISKTQPWTRPREPERLGNLLQRLARDRPALVFVIENLVAEMVAQLDHPRRKYARVKKDMGMKTLILLALVTLLVVAVTPVAAQTQSLAEASRLAIEKRDAKKAADAKAGVESAPRPKTAYTTADLKPGPTNVTPSAPKPPPSGANESARQSAYQQTAQQDEAHWKGRMATLRTTLEADAAQLVAMEARVSTLADSFNGSASLSQRVVVRREYERAVTSVMTLRATVVADRLAFATAEEEGRRAGVPSGWLRP